MGPLAVHFCARFAGVPLREYTLNPQTLAECVVRYCERFRPDAVWVSADTWVSAEAMGHPVAFPGPDQPLAGAGEAFLTARADLDRIPPPDPWRQGRYPRMIEAVARVVEAVGSETLVVACFDQYPFSLACALMGMERLMLALWDDRPLVDALLERCGEYTAAYAVALAAAGADMLSGGDSPAGLIGPRLYREVALPAEQRTIQAIHRRTAVPVSLHICGSAESILTSMSETGADVLEIDQQVDAAAACRLVPPEIALWGNLDPVQVLARGNPADVATTTDSLLATVRAAGRRRFVLSSGCTLAVDTPCENLKTLIEAAHRHAAFSA